MASNDQKWITPSFIATIVGWALTLSMFVWNFSAQSAAMEFRIQSLEEKTQCLNKE